MAAKRFQGIQEDDEIDANRTLVNVLPFRIRFKKSISKPGTVFITLLMSAGVAFWYEQASGWILLGGLCLTGWGLSQKDSLPLKTPIQAKQLDSNQIHPATDKPMPGMGIFFMGNDLRNGKEVWLTNSDARQHFLVLGTTGAGKTEALIGFAANAVSWGSGFLFCDGKGDVSLFAKVYAMARRFGREDDLLVLNFMTGNKDSNAAESTILSNTLNPFSTGSSDGLTQLVVSLMDDVGGDGAMWKGRASAMLTGIMRALCWLRDKGYLDLNVGEIRTYMALRKIIELGDEAKYPDLPAPIRISVRSYLTSLPGFAEEKKEKQAQTTLDQHGYLEMQFTKILGSLADVYGHIFATPYGEVDMYDVVLGRRLLVVMLPALEKSSDEIQNLGKIVCATLKGMMGATLGSKIEGTWEDVVENRPTAAPAPFPVILDEVGYYTVDGMALMAAQARSLGFSMIYASQDVPAMKRLNEKEAASIIANTNTKIFMKTEEPDTTAKLAIDRGGKGIRARVGGYDRKVGDVMGSYAVEGESASYEETDRIDLVDLVRQGEGEMHLIFQGSIIRLKAFYANPDGSIRTKGLKIRANYFVQVARPSMDDIKKSLNGPEILEMLCHPDTPARLAADCAAAVAEIQERAAEGDEIAVAAAMFARATDARRPVVEGGCAAIHELMTLMRGGTGEFADEIRTGYSVPPAGGYGLEGYDDDDVFANAGTFSQREQYQDQRPPVGAWDEGLGGAMDDRPLPVPRRLPPRTSPARIDPRVRHGADVDGTFINAADRMAGNEAFMQSLSKLNFNGDQTTAEEVEEQLASVAGPPPGQTLPMPDINARIVDFDRAADAARIAPEKPLAEMSARKPEFEGGFVSEFLAGLSQPESDDDDDD